MPSTAPRRGCLATSGRGLWRGAGRRVSSLAPGGGRSESVQRAAPCETAAYSLVCGLGRAVSASAKPRAQDRRSAIFRAKTSVIPRRPLAELAWCFLHLPQLEALAVRAIDIKSAATTRRPTHWRITQLAHNTANAAHNTADRNQCAASDIGVSKDCLFSALASAKAAR